MANKTPHVVGGGLGTLRKEAKVDFLIREAAKRQADRKAAFAKMAKAK